MVQRAALACNLLLLISATTAATTTLSSGATFTVTTTNDAGSGSLREAIGAANARPGLDTITFNIPGTGPHTIQPLSPLTPISDPVVIDGYSQPGASSNTLSLGSNASLLIELDGTNAGPGAIGLNIGASGSTVRGLVVNRFGSYGVLIGADNNVVQGNFIGTDRTGTKNLGKEAEGLAIFSGSTNLVGGVTPGVRNVISGNGIAVDIRGSQNKVQGNLIGTDVTGMVALGNGAGIYMADTAANNLIGGAAPWEGNLISGNTIPGGYQGAIVLNGHGVIGTRIQGNLIGTDATGTQPLGNSLGVMVVSANDTRVGGIELGAGNVIAHSLSGAGVEVRSDGPQWGVRNAIRGNAILDNCGGIVVSSLGNSNQTFPLIKSATVMSSQTSVAAILNSTANAAFALDFYASAAMDRCSYAEGQTYLGSTAVNTDAGGNASFIAILPVAVAPGYLITATVTDPAGNTSAFSAPATVIGLSQATALTIAQQPQDVTVAERQTAGFSVKATATPAGFFWVFYQWRKNGLEIPGANAPSFITQETTLAGSGDHYDCVLTIPGATVTSRAALLTVTNDVTPPSLLSAEGNIGLNKITLRFSEPINPTNATNLANYSVNTALKVTNAKLRADQMAVVLYTTAQTSGAEYTVTVNGIHDISAGSNAIVPDSRISFLAYVPEEFVGPFPSWADIKRDYGAVGDGIADDTTALQNALDELGTQGHKNILYLRAGTYRITKTLQLVSRKDLSILGEDPGSTIIKWDGPRDGVMLFCNGLAYSRFGRLTWDGSGQAMTAIDQAWDGKVNYFSTGNEHADEYFKDVGLGIRAGSLTHGVAECAVLRCHFVRCPVAGLRVESSNALDWWIWHSTFEDCRVGASNSPGAGHFHVYGCLFRRSTESDILIGNSATYISFRNNTSIESKAFFTASGLTVAAGVTIQGNTIVDPQDRTPIRNDNLGAVLLLDNVLRSRADVTSGPVVAVRDNLLSVGNIFSVSSPIQCPGRATFLDDKVVARDSLDFELPEMPDTLPNRNRPVIEVPVGADATRIQQAIDEANRARGTRPVVHLPAGNYPINRTLVIPSGCDLQFVGDGFFDATSLNWSGTGQGPMIRLEGPSRATFREIRLFCGFQANGIAVENCDQSGARVFAEQVALSDRNQIDLLVDRLDHTDVSLHDFYFDFATDTSLRVLGGPERNLGQRPQGRVAVFGGGSAGSALTYDVRHSGYLLVQDVWYEGNSPRFARCTDSGTFTLHGGTIAPNCPSPQIPNANTPSIEVNNFRGKLAFLNTGLAHTPQARIEVSGDGLETELLLVGLSNCCPCDGDYEKPYLTNNSPNARVALLASLRSIPTGEHINIADQGAPDLNFLRELLAQTRTEKPRLLFPIRPDATDVRIYRTRVNNGMVGLRLSRQNARPEFASISDQVLNEGETLSLTCNVGDADLPFQTLTFRLLPGAPAGAKIDSATGVFTWTPTEVQAPSTNQVGIVVTDDGSPPLSATNFFSIMASEVNSAPVLTVVLNQTVDEGKLLTVAASATDADIPANVFTYTLAPGAPSGMTIDSASGTIKWTPGAAQAPGSYPITSRVTDNGTPPLSDSKTFTVTVNQVKIVPVLSPIPDPAINEGERLLSKISATVNGALAQNVFFVLGPGAPEGAAIDPILGEFYWTPTEAQGPGAYRILVVVTDLNSRPLTDPKTFTVTVNEVNSAPVLPAIANQSTTEGVPFPLNIAATDADFPTNTLNYALTSAPPGMRIDPATGTISWTPGEDAGGGSFNVTVQVTDNPDRSGPLSDSRTFTVNVTEINSPPALAAIPDGSIDELRELAFTVTATDPDLPANALTFSLDPGAPSGASISSTGAFRWTPTEAQGPGTYPITVRVTDNGTPPLSDTKTFTVTVNEVNEAPVLAAILDKSGNVASPLSFGVTAMDADLPANALAYMLEPGAPQGAAIDPVTAAFTWTPAAEQAGTTNQIAIRVTDNGVPPLSDTKSFMVVVAAQATAPVQLNASLLSNGDVRLVWTTTPGRTYVIQRSADLADWQDLITLNAVGDSLEHIDAAMPAAPMRFYRVVQR